jgi:hypothetical protein
MIVFDKLDQSLADFLRNVENVAFITAVIYSEGFLSVLANEDQKMLVDDAFGGLAWPFSGVICS